MASRLTAAALRHQIAAGQLGPLYLIVGEDEAEKASLAAAFSEAVEPDLRAFNVERIYANETKPNQTKAGEVLDAVQTLPMLAPRRIVVVLQAEQMLAPKRESEATTRDLALLEAYFKAPHPEATLVLVAAALDKRRALTKLLYQQAAVLECTGFEDDGNPSGWVRARVAEAGMTIEAPAVRLLVERAGRDIGRLRADTERSCLFAAEGQKVTLADVKEVVGPATAQDAWGINRQLEQGSAAGALRELGLLFDAGGIPVMILGQLRSFVERHVPPARLPGAVEALFRTDLALKSSAGDPRVLLERLVVELCDPKTPRT